MLEATGMGHTRQWLRRVLIVSCPLEYVLRSLKGSASLHLDLRSAVGGSEPLSSLTCACLAHKASPTRTGSSLSLVES